MCLGSVRFESKQDLAFSVLADHLSRAAVLEAARFSQHCSGEAAFSCCPISDVCRNVLT